MTQLPNMAGALLALAALALPGPTAAADDATYRALGGQDGIRNIVSTFIPLIQADARIAASFQDADMKNLAMRLEQQFCELSGGPCTYKGKDMAEIHDGLNITSAQFNAMTEALQVAMERNGVPSRAQFKLVSRLAPMQRAMVGK